MVKLADFKKDIEAIGNLEFNPVEHDHELQQESTYTEQYMEESELILRCIGHKYKSQRQLLEIAYDNKEITSEVYSILGEILLQQYGKLSNKVEAKRKLLIAERRAI